MYSRAEDDERGHPCFQARDGLYRLELSRIVDNEIIEQREWELSRGEGTSKAALRLVGEQQSLVCWGGGAQSLMLASNGCSVELKANVKTLAHGFERPVKTNAYVLKLDGMNKTLMGAVARDVRLLDMNGVT